MTKPDSTGLRGQASHHRLYTHICSTAATLSLDLASRSQPRCPSGPYPLSLNHTLITSWQCQPITKLALYKMGVLRQGLASIKIFRDASKRETLLQRPPAQSPQSLFESNVNTYLVVLNDKDCNTKQFNHINVNDSVPGDTRISEMCS